MDINQRITLSDKVLSTTIDNEMILLDIKNEKYFGFDEIGATIWQTIQKNPSLTEVFKYLLAEYNVQPKVLKKDLLDFVEKLEKRGVITLESSLQQSSDKGAEI